MKLKFISMAVFSALTLVLRQMRLLSPRLMVVQFILRKLLMLHVL